MQLRFVLPKADLVAACDDERNAYNLRFRTEGKETVVSGPAQQMIFFLTDLASTLDLDSIIQDPVIS